MTVCLGLRPGVRRPVSKDTPDRTDAHPYLSGVRKASEPDKPDTPDAWEASWRT